MQSCKNLHKVKAIGLSKDTTYEKQRHRRSAPGAHGLSGSDAVLSQNEELFANKSVAELLTHLFEKKQYIKGRACQAGRYERDLSASVLSGSGRPSRNRLLCLCYGLEASIEETQELLRLCGIAELYPKRKRDAIIYYGLLHRLDLFTINDRLFDENEDTLC